ncbi:hypothetical protein GCM10020295_12270 [Streptomyces cinereospinus]
MVTNVAAFGAFVDVGVHQDGLVHVSAMSKTFVKDPRDVVKPGDIVKVKVLDVDVPRKRISLTLRLDDEAAPQEQGLRRTPSAARRAPAAAAAGRPRWSRGRRCPPGIGSGPGQQRDGRRPAPRGPARSRQGRPALSRPGPGHHRRPRRWWPRARGVSQAPRGRRPALR